MKNVLLILIILIGYTRLAEAQNCTPDKSLPDSVIVFPLPYQDTIPGTGIMDTACVNSYFETVIQFQIPAEYESPFGTIPINSVDVATEGAVQDAPAGFDYVCNPPNCVFQKDSTGCIVLFGTPDVGSEAVYDLKISILIRSLIDVPLTLPDGALVTGNYFLHVKEEGYAGCTPLATREFLNDYITLTNVPNPFGDHTEIRVSSLLSGNFSFGVFNMLGQRVHQRSVYLNEGANFLPFDGSRLSNGMYHYVLHNQRGLVSGKMMINRQ
ncbi:MAG: T9SS type A sorting domain-containing protein [Saprospiraceae bacterium]|nr:T9SS type A sorting domain-containing protein [Lewinella sp.]